MRRFLVFIIKVYQKTLSPDHGPIKKLFPHGFCRFHPTCSEYAIGVIERYGSVKGIFLGFWRINKCNPWSKGGQDYPKDAKPKQAWYGFFALLIYALIFFMLLLVFTNLLKGA